MEESSKYLSPVYWDRIKVLTHEENEKRNKTGIYPTYGSSSAKWVCHRISEGYYFHGKIQAILRAGLELLFLSGRIGFLPHRLPAVTSEWL